MTALESGSLTKKTIEVGARVATSVKEGGAAAIDTAKSVGQEALKQGSKAWERVKEGPVGMWVLEKRTNRLATKIDRQQQRVDEISGQIKAAGDDYASAAKLGEEQMMRVGKINKYAERRSELAAKLGNHYNQKLEKPREARKGVVEGMNDAVSKRDALIAKYEQYGVNFKKFQERQADFLKSNAYEQSGEMAKIAQSLSEMAKQMDGLREDIATEDRVIETAKNDISKWDTKHTGTQQQMQRWSETAFNGRHGTSSLARTIEVQAKGPAEEPKTSEVSAEEAPAKVPAIDNYQREGSRRSETVRPLEGVSGKALYAFLSEIFSEDLRKSLKEGISKLSKADVMTGPEGRGKVDAFIKLWNKFAINGTPEVDAIQGPALKFLEEHKNTEVDLVEFGVLLLEEGGFTAEDIKTGIGRIAEQWNSSLEKQKKAA